MKEHPIVKRKWDWWLYPAALAAILQAVAIFAALRRFGETSIVFWYLAQGLFSPLAGILLLLAVAHSLWKRPFIRLSRALGFLLLLAGFLTPRLMTTYPSSHDATPSKVHFRVPLDGPVTVGWGGATKDVNYHVIAPDQRWAYDLFITKEGQPCHGDGAKLTDYYCYGMRLLAPAEGIVTRTDDGHQESAPGKMGGNPAGGNQVVIQVAPKEFLFLCHMQPGSIRVKPGQHIQRGEPLGLVGNSGNTSMPHVHIHLQDTDTDDWGEGIPLEFYHYRTGERIVEHGIPHGGSPPEIIENVSN